MSKNIDKYIRLPIHLACKTCPNTKVDCYIELTPEYPKGNLHNRCATCLSKNCAFVKMDATSRMEIRTWLDTELRRRRDLAAANPAFGRDAIAEIIEIDAGAAPRAGRKRTRLNVDEAEEEDEEDGDADQAPPATRTRSRIDAGPSRTHGNQEDLAEKSDFVQQAIELVRTSQTNEPQLAKLRAEVKVAKDARVAAESKLRGTGDLEQELKDKDGALEAATKREQVALDKVKRVEKTEADAWAQVDRLRKEVAQHKMEITEANKVKEGLEVSIRGAGAKVSLAEKEIERLRKEVETEKEVNVKKSKDVLKWKNVATLATQES
jgi:hypothetical protein